MKKFKIETVLGLIIAILIVLGLAFALVVLQMWIWNTLFVGIFGLPMLNFWQMLLANVFVMTFYPKGNFIKFQIDDGE